MRSSKHRPWFHWNRTVNNFCTVCLRDFFGAVVTVIGNNKNIITIHKVGLLSEAVD